jgi:hypothetical protein
MDENPRGDPLGRMRLTDIKFEPGSEELLESPAMQPYLRFATAMIQQQDLHPAMEEIRALPLEQRYVWRVASALKWAFADFDTLNVEVDRTTLSPEDRLRIVDLLKLRPTQFCLFLSALPGEEQMKRLLISGIRSAREVAAMDSRLFRAKART